MSRVRKTTARPDKQLNDGGFLKKNIRTYLPASISGALLVFCFPTFDFYPVTWFALVPLLVSLLDKKPKEAFTAGMLMGIFYFFGTIYWIYHSISHYGGIPLAISLGLVLLLSLYLSLYTGMFAMIFSMKMVSTKLPALFLAPVFWVTLELIRSYALTGFPWSSIGYSQYKLLYGIQFADITGIYGVSFVVVAINGALADFFIIRKRQQTMPLFPLSHTIVGYAVLLMVLLSIFSYGYWRLHQERPGDAVRVSIIQGNIEQDKKWVPAYQEDVINIYKELTATTTTFSLPPSLVIWPETSLPFYFGFDASLSNDLIAFQRQLNSYLLAGSVIVKKQSVGGKPVQLTNSAVLFDREGNISYVYDKIHLVPFGEYVPLRGILFFVDKLVSGIGDFVPGDKLIKARTDFGQFGTYICYEIIFPGLVRKLYAKDGDLIVNITNDAWFGRTAGPYQHFSMGVFRAIENRKPVLRAANTGVSGYIDSNGRIQRTTQIFERTVLTVDIMTDRSRSFYSRYGDLFAYLCIVLAILLLI